MSALTSKLATTRWRLPLRRVKRRGAIAVVAVCKLALLFSTFESAGNALEMNGETLDARTVETANALAGHVAPSRTMLAKSLAVRCLRRAPGIAGNGVERPLRTSRMAGHRLPNGLCAPMQC